MLRLFKNTGNLRALLLAGIASIFFQGQVYSQELTVASYNIRYSNEGDSLKGNGWDQRAPVIAQLIQFHDFDIFGTQEGKYGQLLDLKRLMPEYNFIGIGRDDGKQAGEFAAIFYKTDQYKLLDKGDFWLSTETNHPNKGWDAALPRVCSWGHFEDIKSGKTFYFFNVHFDHIGVEARRESAKLILDKIRIMAGDEPTILTGDFNVDQDNESYHLLNDSDILQDAYDKASIRYALNGTYNDFNPNLKTGRRIDHIFLTKDFNVSRYGILLDSYRAPNKEEARLPSDHFPVMIKIKFEDSNN